MKPLLQAAGIGKSYAALPVLRDFSLTLSRGEIVCLLGASGCGKTTFLKIAAGEEKADAGTLARDLPVPGPQFSFLRQEDRLLPWRTVLQNVALGLELTGVAKKEAEKTAAGLLDRFGLGAFGGAAPAEISGGMRQRALVARALATAPHLLLMDEPLSSLDLLARRELAGLIRASIKETGAGAIIVTHSVEEAAFLADRILLVSQRPARVVEELPVSGALEILEPATEKLMAVLEGRS